MFRIFHLIILIAIAALAGCSGKMGLGTTIDIGVISGAAEEDGQDDGISIEGTVYAAASVNQNISSKDLKAATLGTDTPASGYHVYCYNFSTGSSCGEGITDENGQFSIAGVDDSLILDPNDSTKARLWIKAESPSGQHQVINFTETESTDVESAGVVSVSADTDTTIAAQLLLDRCKEYDSSCAIGAPLPSTMTSEITAGSFNPLCYLDLNRSYLDGADMSGSGFKGAMGALRQGIRCMVSMGISPRTCGEFDTSVQIVSAFSREAADSSLIECMSNTVSGACGIDADTFSSNMNSANNMLGGIRRATATSIASDSTICGEITQGTSEGETIGTAIRETMLSFESKDEVSSIFSTRGTMLNFINIARDSGDFGVFTEKPRAFIGMIESGITSEKYVEAYEVMRAWTPQSGTTAEQHKMWGTAMNRIFAVSDSGEIATHADLYINYLDSNIVRSSVDVGGVNFLNMYNDIKGAIGLSGGNTTLANQFVSAVRVDSYQIGSAAEREAYEQQIALVQQQQQQGQVQQVDFTNRYETQNTYSGMCQTYLSTNGYTQYYQQYCGSVPAAAVVAANAGNSQATISWNAVSGASSYNLYWGTSASAITNKISAVSRPYTHASLTNGTTYYYIVKAVNSHGEGTASSTVSATPLPDLPAAPGSVAAAAGDTETSVSWASVAGATSYNIYFGTSSGVTKDTGTKITGASSPYTHTGLSNGTAYYYVVTAVNLRGEGVISQQSSATPNYTAPGAPGGVSSAAGNTQVTVSWNSVSGATAYNIYWRTQTGVTTANGTKISNATSPYVHTGRTNATAYYYIVVAVNSGVEGPSSLETNATPLPPVPDAPSGVAASEGDTSVDISWNSVSGATSYNIYWRTSTGVTKQNGTKISNATSPYTHSDLSNGTAYYYIVTAENIGGEGNASSEVNATPQAALVLFTQVYNGTGNGNDMGHGIAVDSSGNSFVCGKAQLATTVMDIWLTKYDVSGNLQWTKTLDSGFNKNEQCNKVSLDSSGNIYVAGYYFSVNSASNSDMWLRKYDSGGNTVWTHTYAGASNLHDQINDVVVDGSGNVYITGFTQVGSIDNTDMFVRKIDSSGNTVWTGTYNGAMSLLDYGYGIALDSDGNVYVAGSSTDGIDEMWTHQDILIRKYNNSGAVQWTKTLNGPVDLDDVANAIVLDASGNIYVTGYMTIAGQHNNIWVAKYNSSGTQVWSTNINGTANTVDWGNDIALDASGNIYVAGTLRNTGTNDDIWVRKYNNAGTTQWTQTYNDPSNNYDQGNSIAISAAGGVYVTGTAVISNYDIWTRVFSATDGSFNP